MKKLLLPFEGTAFPRECLELVRQLHRMAPVSVTAAFVQHVDYANLWSSGGGVPGSLFIPLMEEDDTEEVEANCRRVEQFLSESDIPFQLHRDRMEFALESIRKETRFADLLIMSSVHFFENINDNQPNAYMKLILHASECPVLLVPEKVSLPGELLLAYDGSASAAYAIKQFAYLFREFSGIPATLIHFGEKKETGIPDEVQLKEFLPEVFRQLHFENTRMNSEDYFHQRVLTSEHPWMVAGAFGRSEFSQLFSRSFITGLIQDHQIPLFLTHY